MTFKDVRPLSLGVVVTELLRRRLGIEPFDRRSLEHLRIHTIPAISHNAYMMAVS
jgi:hypothetical protein